MNKLFKNKKNNQTGFTLVELMISILIIGVLTTMVITNFNGSNQKIILENEAERMSSVIRQMDIDSLIGQTVTGGVRPPAFGFNIKTCVHTDIPDFCTYTSFADDQNNGTLDYKFDVGDIIIQAINTFEKNVEFVSISTPTDNNIPEINIVFVPPHGNIQFFGSGTTALSDEEVTIVLHYHNSSYNKSIIINRISGQIEIQ